jgi:hypothetical protein
MFQQPSFPKPAWQPSADQQHCFSHRVHQHVCGCLLQKPWDRENSHSRMYVQQLKSLAAKHKAGFLNIFEEWQKDPSWASKLLQPDMLHLSSEGNKLLFQQIQAAITEQVPAMAWENVALHYPLMDAIDKVRGILHVVRRPTS